VLVLLYLTASGCGFQPRGHAVALSTVPGPVFIAGIASYSDLYRALKLQLDLAGVEIAPSAADSASVLRISGVRSAAEVVAFNSRNKAIEYELEESAFFSLHAADGRQLVENQRIQVLRIQYRPEVGVLGSDREGELLREDMRKEIAERIVRRLATQT
jgi:LPS-assembly lipoprotein